MLETLTPRLIAYGLRSSMIEKYEQTLKVTAILHRQNEPIQYTLEQFKRREKPFTLVINSPTEIFEMGDVVLLNVTKIMDGDKKKKYK